MNIQFESLRELFQDDSAVPKDLMKPMILEDFRDKNLIGVPEANLQITFDTADGSDILIRKIDPEKALGYRTYEDESDYFNQLQLDMYVPGEG